MIETKLKITTLRSKTKEDLISIIENLYREREQILDAIHYIKSDLELIEKGDALHVHDNP